MVSLQVRQQLKLDFGRLLAEGTNRASSEVREQCLFTYILTALTTFTSLLTIFMFIVNFTPDIQ